MVVDTQSTLDVNKITPNESTETTLKTDSNNETITRNNSTQETSNPAAEKGDFQKTNFLKIDAVVI